MNAEQHETKPMPMSKRLLDLVLVLGTAPLWLPILAVVSVLILMVMGTPVFFVQRRPGLGGRPFSIIKFRTMTSAKGKDGKLLPDEKRLTKLGRFLRATSLDELPELINVLTGELSLVGPRPLLMHYLPLYSPEQARRHEVVPGITGWAQVNGRNAITWEDKFNHDVWYVDNRSLMLDVKILWITLVKVFKREGIGAEGHATMPEFTGNKTGDDGQK